MGIVAMFFLVGICGSMLFRCVFCGGGSSSYSKKEEEEERHKEIAALVDNDLDLSDDDDLDPSEINDHEHIS